MVADASQEFEPAVAVVERYTPDGLPVFSDLYRLGEPGPVVADAVLDAIEKVLPSITTPAALMALGQLNAEAIEFVTDLGTKEQKLELKQMVDRRKAEIEDAGNVAPRRRSSAAVN